MSACHIWRSRTEDLRGNRFVQFLLYLGGSLCPRGSPMVGSLEGTTEQTRTHPLPVVDGP